ncbi:MAG: hypothetical protein TIS_01098 [Tissierella sp.]
MEEAELEKYINIFKKTFSNKYLNRKNIDEEESIEELIYIKSALIDEKEHNWYRYMTLNEYKEKKVLPTILKYSEKVKKDNSSFNKQRNNDNKSKDSRQKSPKKDESFGNRLDLSNINNSKKQNKKKK